MGGKYGAYGSTPPPGMLDPTTLLQGGFGGFSYGDPEGMGPGAVGTPSILKGAFPRTAGYILQGAEGASREALQGFEAQYRARAQGAAAGFGQQQDRLGGEVASQGYNPDLVRRMLSGGAASTQAQIGGYRAEADQGAHQFLAEMLNNTGISLADLSRDQINVIMQSYLAKQARKAGTQAGWTQLAGSALGAGATLAKAGV